VIDYVGYVLVNQWGAAAPDIFKWEIGVFFRLRYIEIQRFDLVRSNDKTGVVSAEHRAVIVGTAERER
jgi:hypothetical protein